jgi:hypothetical protein
VKPIYKAEIDPSLPTGCNYSRIDVRSSTIGSTSGSQVPDAYFHLFTVYTDKDGDEIVYRGGPGGPTGSYDPLEWRAGSTYVEGDSQRHSRDGLRYRASLSESNESDKGRIRCKLNPSANCQVSKDACKSRPTCFDRVQIIFILRNH